MAVVFDKIAGTASDASGSVQTLDILVAAGGVSIGDAVFFSVCWQDASRVLSTITDVNRGNTCRVDLVVGPGNNNVRGAIGCCYVGTALLANDPLRLTFSGAGGVGPAIAARADAFSGWTALPVLDVSTSNPNNLSTTPTTGSITPTNATDLLIAAFCGRLEGTGTVTGDAAFTTMGSNNAGANLASVTSQYKIVSTSAAYSATASATAATDWESLIIAYKQEGGSPAFSLPVPFGAREARLFSPGVLTRADAVIGEASAQQAHPSFDNLVSTWTRGGIDRGSLFAQIDEAAPGDDADYITSTSS